MKGLMMTSKANIVHEAGRTWWKCGCCGHTLGELANGNVIIKAGPRYLIIRMMNDQVQRCPSMRCGMESVLEVDQVAA